MPTLTFSDTSFPSNTVMILPFSQFLSSFQIFEFSVLLRHLGLRLLRLEHMAHLLPLGLQVEAVVGCRCNLDRHPLSNDQAEILH